MTVYQKIDKYLFQHEKGKYTEKPLDNIADYIDCAWKWHKITKDEMENAADRVCALYNAELEKIINRAKENET